MNDIYVRADGCILLGPMVTCDGFHPNTRIRVQSHVHHDHLKDLERSKGHQDKIVCTRETYELLCAEFNADLPFRRSQWSIMPADGRFRKVLSGDPTEIAFHPSGHMLGSVITSVRYDDGRQYTYTSDFSWPLRTLPERSDVLVVDATYGDPANIRNYDENHVLEVLLDFVREKSAQGPILLSGHRGRLQYAIQLLTSMVKMPVLVSKHVGDTLSVYMQYQGFDVDFHQLGTSSAQELIRSGIPFLGFVETRDRPDLLSLQAQVRTRILLSAFMVPKEEPLVTLRNGLTRVAFTDHADFSGTIDLIKAIDPRRVIADGTRGGAADVLARFIESELGIPADSNVVPISKEWGWH